MKKIILIAGGTGLIGQRLLELLGADYEIRILTRQPRAEGQFAWNPQQGTIDEQALTDVHAVVNLAGAGIADKRWTAARKRELIESRTQSGQLLYDAMQRMTTPRPQVYVGASAIGIYGDTAERWLSETDVPTQLPEPFMVDCCKQWESATERMNALGMRTMTLRIGVVMTPDGGAMAEIIKPMRFGIGAYFDSGQAWYSWIHRDDMCRVIHWAISQPLQGVYNAVAPHPVRNIELTKVLARVMGRRVIFVPAFGFMLRLVLGEMAAVVLNSNRVSAQKLLDTGFEFQYPHASDMKF
jgi:uncharacterized protein